MYSTTSKTTDTERITSTVTPPSAPATKYKYLVTVLDVSGICTVLEYLCDSSQLHNRLVTLVKK